MNAPSNERLRTLAHDVTLDSFAVGPLDARDFSAACLELIDARAAIANRIPSKAPDLDRSPVADGLRDAATVAGPGPLAERLNLAARVIDKLVEASGAALLRDDVRDGELGDMLRGALIEAGAL